ncbi:MAG: FAD-dependent thymidylate synthase [Candidatus Schekmanbacteria bacterium]|nr:FAD-dependent thymidylate synthase [Candidatus Schekmanbacteria bacterium]
MTNNLLTSEVELISITADAEKVIEDAGRTCYLSFEKSGDATAGKFIRMLIKSGHHSVLEHAYATFRIRGGSRAFTHQLVRHRLCAFSQQSQRYVSEKQFDYVEPPSISSNPEAHRLFLDAMESAQSAYRELQKLGIKNEDARFVLPNAVKSEIVVSADFREWRHILELRLKPDAQWEIKDICREILRILKEKAPSVFEDMNG